MHFVIRTIDVGAILRPGDLIAWLLVGLIAGYLANVLVRGRGAGCLGNIVIGLIGSVIGAILASALDVGQQFHFCGTIFVSFIGAAILLAVLRLFTSGR
ncbi:MAG TPA: GlsB/YeaQ/YmgE family stress response membrane protein [Ktedonosporobacter sp.]|nr:GlsB/YeaQ/YmgE family stress response membrane protein [Ktedonosporobacter sp.]